MDQGLPHRRTYDLSMIKIDLIKIMRFPRRTNGTSLRYGGVVCWECRTLRDIQVCLGWFALFGALVPQQAQWSGETPAHCASGAKNAEEGTGKKKWWGTSDANASRD